MIVILDSAPLGLASNPNSAEARSCCAWLDTLLPNNARVVVPEIADYEVRRELIRAQKTRGLRLLDQLLTALEYLPITTTAMRTAAALWAQARQRGRPTAANHALDGDVILAAQAIELRKPQFIIATTNIGHLTCFCPAALWSDIAATDT